MNRWAKAVAAVAVVVIAVIAVDQSQRITGAVRDAAGVSAVLTLAIIAAAAFLETGVPVFSAFMPGEFTVILAGSLAAAGVLHPVAVFAVVWPCSFAGDLSSYALGRRYGRPLLLRDRGRFTLSPEQLASADATIKRYGTASILIGRFLPVARALVPFLAGAGKTPIRTFAAVDLVATGAFSVAFISAGYYGTDLYRSAPWAIVAIAIAIAIGLGLALRRRRRPQQESTEPSSHNPSLCSAGGTIVRNPSPEAARSGLLVRDCAQADKPGDR